MWSLMILKPDIVAHRPLLQQTLRELLEAGIIIGGAQKLLLTRQKAEELYGVHKGKFFYPRLVRHVTSGPVIAMRVSGDVRRILGSSRLYPIPEIGVRSSLRQRYALSDVRNVAHASDAEAAQRELALFEPLPPSEPLLSEILA
ncbi:NDK domain-containing protein [Trichostrongylus colubriformis]|uniref:Nucleoside diphosphate kinase n=1 Tax=Trichostrongylus colubriformis TaxID=6319 RepID=A0AAN8FQG4_TRICO